MLTTSAKEPSHTLPAQDDVTNAPSLIDTRVYLRDINDGSIGIFVIYWYHPPNYWDYLAFSEKLNLRIMAEFEAEQIPFARPALAIHMVEPGPPEPRPQEASEGS